MWSINNDRQSVTVGINYKIRMCKRAGLTPRLIRLGREHSRLFWKERGLDYIPAHPLPMVCDGVTHDGTCWVYSKRKIPMRFGDKAIIGIVVDGD